MNKSIYEIYGLDYSNQIFDKLSNIPWDEGKYSASVLNMLYSVHSGNKLISPVIERLLNDDEELSDDSKSQIAQMLSVMYMDNWTYLYKALMADYNPIYNYGMEESETIGEVGSNNETINGSSTINNTVVTDRDLKSTTSSENNDTSNEDVINKVYGENSEEPVNDSSSSSNSSDTSKSSGSDTSSEDASETTSGNTTDKQETVKGDKRDTTRKLTREGNIGVTTSQQMIDSEVKLRETKFWELVFKDIDSLLTLSIYK